MNKTLGFLLALAATAQPALAQGAKFDLDALRTVARLRDVALSPDGKSVLAVVSRPDYEANRYQSELILVDPSGGALRSLSSGRRYLAEARWSPTGDRIAFLSPASEQNLSAQVWVLPVAGGEARRITDVPGGVDQYAWSPDGRSLALAVSDTAPRREGEEKHNDSFEIGEDDYLIQGPAMPDHVWIVADTGGKARRLTEGSWSMTKSDASSAMTWSPDGKSIAVASQPTPHSGAEGQAVIRVIDVATGTARVVGKGFGTSPEFSPDSRSVLASRPRGTAPWFSSHGLVAIDVASGQERWITERVDRAFWNGHWLADGRVVTTAADAAVTKAWIFGTDGVPTPVDLGGTQTDEISRLADGAMAWAGSTPARAAEIYYVSPGGGAPRRLTDLQGGTAKYAIAKNEVVEWDIGKGMKADGVVTYPPGYQAGTKYPLVAWFHGGPMGTSTSAFSEMIQIFAAQGWIVFEPNYRGSTDRGNDFQSSIIGDAGDGPGRDAMAGIRSLIQRGLVDTTRMAISGWSYGGYMTAWLMGHYQGWKAAVAGAPLVSNEDSYQLSDISITYGVAWGGSPYDEKLEAPIRAQSPITWYRNMRTPTLILHDTGDRRVPFVESFRLYRALKDRGVPVQFVAYPTGGHFPSDPVRIRDIYRRATDWIAEHFK